MVYTEVQVKGRKRAYYRTISVRNGDKVGKKRVFLGSDLDEEELHMAEKRADAELDPLNGLLTGEDHRRLERIRKVYRTLPASTYGNRYESFISSFTHDSTAIEGNTLTLKETGSLLFDSISPSSRPMKDIMEVLNHREALDHLLRSECDISKDLVLELHGMMMKGTLDAGLNDQIGKYRTYQVYIRGTDWMPPSPKDVPRDMATLLRWYSRNRKRLHPVVVAAYFHVGFEIIHPYVDGNGRVGRLLMDLILHRNGYPMVNIPNARKNEYYDHLERGQLDGDLRPFVSFLIELMEKNKVMI